MGEVDRGRGEGWGPMVTEEVGCVGGVAGREVIMVKNCEADGPALEGGPLSSAALKGGSLVAFACIGCGVVVVKVVK